VIAVLVALLAGRRSASLREEIAQRESAQLQAIADHLQRQAERSERIHDFRLCCKLSV